MIFVFNIVDFRIKYNRRNSCCTIYCQKGLQGKTLFGLDVDADLATNPVLHYNIDPNR